jgi:hypothetical protein
VANQEAGGTTDMPGALAQLEGWWTMTAKRITCVCPQCRRSYRVLAKTTGRRARCGVCGMTFRVVTKIPPPPTEDDILNWLSEEEDQDEVTAEGSQNASGALTASFSGASKGSRSLELHIA